VKKFGEREARLMFEDAVPTFNPATIPTVPRSDDKFVRPPAATMFSMQAALPARQYASVEQVDHPTASRAFIIGKSRSATGYPILFQATADGPTVHMSGAGINVAGWFWGPFGPLLMGRSENFGFLVTAANSNVNDVFVEKLNPDNPRQYLYKGAWRDMEVRPQTIHVKGGAPVQYEQEYTVHGPVVDRPAGQNVAHAVRYALVGYEMSGLAGMVDANHAKNLEEFRNGHYRNSYDYNHYYIGEDGTIAYIHAGNTPIRVNGVDLRLPTPGTGEYEWQGFLAPDKHPQVVNPEQDYLFNWNTAPSANWPSLGAWGQTARAWWAERLFKEKASNITKADAREWHRRIGVGSTDPAYPKYFTPYLRPAVANDPKLLALVDAMEGWDSLYEDKNADGVYDDVGLTIYLAWSQIAVKQIVEDDYEGLGNRPRGGVDLMLRVLQGKDAKLPVQHDWLNGKDRNEVIRKTLADTAAELTKQYGSSDIKAWKRLAYHRYYDCSEIAKNPDKPYYPYRPCVGGNRGSSTFTLQTAAKLGLQPKYIPDNMSEAWLSLMEITPKDRVLRDATPTGGQNLFINTKGEGNPNIADQVNLHLNFDTKNVELMKDKVMAGAVSTQNISYTPGR
jgi:penicillin amidase